MIKVQLTSEFMEWFTEEFRLVTDEPLGVAQDIVTQLWVTGCIPEPAPALAAEVAALKAQVEAMRRAASALLDSLGTMGVIDDPFIAPDIIDVRAALGGE